MIFWSPPSSKTSTTNTTSPLLRRLTSKNKSYSDLAVTAKASLSLSRANSKHSDRYVFKPSPLPSYVANDYASARTLVGVRTPKSEKDFRYDADLDALLVGGLPPLPPKDSGPPVLPLPSCLLESKAKLAAKPDPRVEAALAQESVGTSLPKPKAHPESEDSEPEYPWYRRRLHFPRDSTPKPSASHPPLFPRVDFAVSASRSSHASLSLFGGLVNVQRSYRNSDCVGQSVTIDGTSHDKYADGQPTEYCTDFNAGTGQLTEGAVVPRLRGQYNQQFQMGYASAMAMLLFAVVLVVTAVQVWVGRRYVHYAGDQS